MALVRHAQENNHNARQSMQSPFPANSQSNRQVSSQLQACPLRDPQHYNRLTRSLLITGGWLCVALGVAGIFLPLMPTTVFILMAAWCFSRSHQGFYRWLLANKYLGPIVTAWQQGRGLAPQTRNRILLILWSSLVLSALLISNHTVTAVLLVLGLALSAYLVKLSYAFEG